MSDVPEGVCSIPDCDSTRVARSWCSKHYQRWRSSGNPVHVKIGKGRRWRDADHCFDVMTPDRGFACWEWRGSVGNHGYGRIRLRTGEDRIEILAHRFSYERYVAPIPRGLSIDHLCRNRLCVNPSHLDAVTLAENVKRQWEAARREAR